MDSRRSLQLQARLDPWVIAASLAVIPVVLVEMFTNSETLLLAATILNWLSWSVFLVESVVMLRAAGWEWARNNPLPLLVTVITVPLTPPITALARILRFVRLIRLLPGLQSARRLFTLEGLRYAALISVGLIVFGGLLFTEIEAEQNLEPMEGVWWAMTTVTTVGYGDLYPTTVGGRVLATGLMVLGIGFVALVTGFIAEQFLATGRSEQSEAQEDLRHQLTEIQGQLTELQDQIARFRPPEQ